MEKVTPATVIIDPAVILNPARLRPPFRGNSCVEVRPLPFVRTIHAIETGQDCRQATKRKILTALGVAWEHRGDYFAGPRAIRATREPIARSA